MQLHAHAAAATMTVAPRGASVAFDRVDEAVDVCDEEGDVTVAEDGKASAVADGDAIAPNAYTMASVEPTYTAPSPPMAGDEYTGLPVV